MPILAGLLTGLAIAAAGAGVGESAAASGAATKGQTEQNQIAAQEQANRNQAFQQAEQFYTPYTQNGSPFLQNIQAQGARQNAQQFGNAVGNFKQQMQVSGLGYGPSGSTAAGEGQIAADEAASSTSTYLQNLLNNENLKFQAQQGITQAASAGGPQVTPNSQVIPTTTGSSVNAFGQALNNLSNPSGGGFTPQAFVPNPNIGATNGNPYFNEAAMFSAPTTGGTSDE